MFATFVAEYVALETEKIFQKMSQVPHTLPQMWQTSDCNKNIFIMRYRCFRPRFAGILT
jgi:hypothetical protein